MCDMNPHRCSFFFSFSTSSANISVINQKGRYPMQKTKRILALAGVILLVGMYLITLVLALISSPATKGMVMASLGCTIVIPCFLYAFMLIARVLDNRGAQKEDQESTDSTAK